MWCFLKKSHVPENFGQVLKKYLRRGDVGRHYLKKRGYFRILFPVFGIRTFFFVKPPADVQPITDRCRFDPFLYFMGFEDGQQLLFRQKTMILPKKRTEF